MAGGDLAEAIWGDDPISFRRLESLIKGLPVESRVARDLGAPKPGDWSLEHELLAAVADRVGMFNRNFVKANSKKGAHVPDFKPIRRPERRSDQPKKPATPEELAAALGGTGFVTYTPKEE